MSQSENGGSPLPTPRPGWVTPLVGLGRIVGFVILLIGVFMLRMLRRTDPILALVLVALLAMAAMLLAGVGWYADLLLRDSRRERPSRLLAAMDLLLGVALAIVAFHGVDTDVLEIRPIEGLHPGFLSRAGYGYAYSFGYGFPVALGMTLAAVGLAALVGRGCGGQGPRSCCLLDGASWDGWGRRWCPHA